MGRACPLCPRDSDINLFGNRERVVNLDAEIADRAFNSMASCPVPDYVPSCRDGLVIKVNGSADGT